MVLIAILGVILLLLAYVAVMVTVLVQRTIELIGVNSEVLTDVESEITPDSEAKS